MERPQHGEQTQDNFVVQQVLQPLAKACLQAEQVNPRMRRGTEQKIWEEILLAFQAEAQIDLAYPTIRYFTPENVPPPA